MKPFDTKNLEYRYVITGDGKGTLIGLDDKDNPRVATIKYGSEFRCYPVEECFEVSNGI